MMELPEAVNMARQITETLRGKRIPGVTAAHTPHKLAWYYGEPGTYSDLPISQTTRKPTHRLQPSGAGDRAGRHRHSCGIQRSTGGLRGTEEMTGCWVEDSGRDPQNAGAALVSFLRGRCQSGGTTRRCFECVPRSRSG